MAQLGLWQPPAGQAASKTACTPNAVGGFRALGCETVAHYVAARPALQRWLGPADGVDSWVVQEVGGSNADGLNSL